MVNAYGPTEASDDVTHHIMDGPPAGDIVPIGRPIQNCNVYVLDREMELVPIGSVGEVSVSGVGVGRGYVGEPEMSAEVFLVDPFRDTPSRLYKTGDNGRWLPDGSLQLLGRTDNQIKFHGFNIFGIYY